MYIYIIIYTCLIRSLFHSPYISLNHLQEFGGAPTGPPFALHKCPLIFQPTPQSYSWLCQPGLKQRVHSRSCCWYTKYDTGWWFQHL